MAFTTEDAHAYIDQVRWRFAKTMPRWPHEYTVRDWRPDLDREFTEFVALIRSDGIVKPWPRDAAVPRYHHTYLPLDGWEYWSMGAPIPETTVINRALVVGPERAKAHAFGSMDPNGAVEGWEQPPSSGPACPICGSRGVPFLYGLPSSEGFEAADRGELVIGGCDEGDEQPTHRCTNGHEWRHNEPGRTRDVP